VRKLIYNKKKTTKNKTDVMKLVLKSTRNTRRKLKYEISITAQIMATPLIIVILKQTE
jgi:hypothetical protein